MTDKEILMINLTKRFKTTMIGAIAQFEESFGYLWEQDNINREHFEDLWEETRNIILNNGNRQLRAAIDEVSGFISDGPKQKYQYKFYLDNNNKPYNGE